MLFLVLSTQAGSNCCALYFSCLDMFVEFVLTSKHCCSRRCILIFEFVIKIKLKNLKTLHHVNYMLHLRDSYKLTKFNLCFSLADSEVFEPDPHTRFGSPRRIDTTLDRNILNSWSGWLERMILKAMLYKKINTTYSIFRVFRLPFNKGL